MKARIPKHREFIINFPDSIDQNKANEGWAKLQQIVEDYKKAHNGASVYAPTFIEDCEPEVKKLQEEYGFEYTVEFVQKVQHRLIVKGSLHKPCNDPFCVSSFHKMASRSVRRCAVLHLVVQTDAVFVVGTHLAVCHCHMRRVGGVAFESLGALKGGVQHQVGVGGGERINVDMDVHKPRNLAGKAFQALLDASLDGGFFLGGQFVLQLPENNVLDHNKKPPAFFLIVTG